MEIIKKTNKVNEEMCKKLCGIIIFFTNNNYDTINRIFICSEEKYGSVIKDIDKDSQITQGDTFNGFGKTIQNSDNNSDIIIREEIILALLNTVKFEDKLLSITDMLPIKSILHEIGHSISNKINGPVYFKKNYSWSTTTLAEYLNQYYLIEKDEYRAEYYANDFLLQKINNDYDSELYSNIDNEYDLFETEKNKLINKYNKNYDEREYLFKLIQVVHVSFIRQLFLKKSYIDVLKNRKLFIKKEINKDIKLLEEYDIEINDYFNSCYYNKWRRMMKLGGFELTDISIDTPLKDCFKLLINTKNHNK